jgi:hypothetical protein
MRRIPSLLRVPFLDDLAVDLILNRREFISVKSDGRL